MKLNLGSPSGGDYSWHFFSQVESHLFNQFKYILTEELEIRNTKVGGLQALLSYL